MIPRKYIYIGGIILFVSYEIIQIIYPGSGIAEWVFYFVFGALAIVTAALSPKFSAKYEKQFTQNVTRDGWQIVADDSNQPALPQHMLPEGQALLGSGQEIEATAQKQIGDAKVTIGYVNIIFKGKNSERRVPLVYLLAPITGSVRGWVRIRSAKSYFAGFGKDIQMESVQFNKEVDVRASSPKFAFQVFSPDFMEWYMELSPRPWIHVENSVCGLVFEGMPNKAQLNVLLSWFQQARQAVIKSGALEKTGPTA